MGEINDYFDYQSLPQNEKGKKSFKWIILLIIVLLAIMGALYFFLFYNQPYCGDGKVDKEETMENCCKDVGCLGEQTCQNNTCIEPLCGKCQFLDVENHKCVNYLCCSDFDCNDRNLNTVDRCYNPKTINSFCKSFEKQEFAILESKNKKTIEHLDVFPFLKEFYGIYGDDFDFLIIYSDFDTSEENIYFAPVMNESIQGIGKNFFNSTIENVSKLKGYVWAGDARNIFQGFMVQFNPVTSNGLIHELTHKWCCYASFKDWNGQENENWLQGGIHWSKFLDTGTNDPMGETKRWIDNGDGTLTWSSYTILLDEVHHHSDFTLYLMGLIPPEQVSPIKFAETQEEILDDRFNDTITGKIHYIDINDLISIEGERIPNYKESQKDFKVGFILWAKDESNVSTQTINNINKMRGLLEEQWFEATGGKSKIDTVLYG